MIRGERASGTAHMPSICCPCFMAMWSDARSWDGSLLLRPAPTVCKDCASGEKKEGDDGLTKGICGSLFLSQGGESFADIKECCATTEAL